MEMYIDSYPCFVVVGFLAGKGTGYCLMKVKLPCFCLKSAVAMVDFT